MAVAVKALYPSWPWATAALLGVIVSPTDPIATLTQGPTRDPWCGFWWWGMGDRN